MDVFGEILILEYSLSMLMFRLYTAGVCFSAGILNGFTFRKNTNVFWSYSVDSAGERNPNHMWIMTLAGPCH